METAVIAVEVVWWWQLIAVFRRGEREKRFFGFGAKLVLLCLRCCKRGSRISTRCSLRQRVAFLVGLRAAGTLCDYAAKHCWHRGNQALCRALAKKRCTTVTLHDCLATKMVDDCEASDAEVGLLAPYGDGSVRGDS